MVRDAYGRGAAIGSVVAADGDGVALSGGEDTGGSYSSRAVIAGWRAAVWRS
jgi:hypothetical protein